MVLLALLATAALLGMAGITVANLALFPRLAHPVSRLERWLLDESKLYFRMKRGFDPPVMASPLVSVLVPARNEAVVIRRTVARLLEQDYPCFELIVLDDHSTDGTGDLARAAGHGDGRLRVIPGTDLPRGWAGKNWACHQLAQAARGDLLVFTDADTLWLPGGLSAVVAEQVRTNADLLTVWPTQVTETWPERLVVPLMALVVIGYLPVFLTHYAPWTPFAAATGQCLAFRRAAYDAIGGHAVVRGEVLEDVKFARRIKAAHLHLRMADGDGLVACRMYTDWPSVRDGYAKNILAGYGSSLFFMGMATLFHWLVFLLPPAWLVAPAGKAALKRRTTNDVPAGRAALKRRTTNIQPVCSTAIHRRSWPWWPLALTALGMGLRAVTARFTRQRGRDALLMPVSAVLMTIISARSAWWQVRYGGPMWKGRVIKPAREAEP
jgi:chlorobactene glucosyltransferase